MNKNKCDPILLTQFFDQELEPDEHARVSEHVRGCLFCQKSLRDNQSVSSVFKAGIDKTVARTRFDTLEERILSQVQNSKPETGNRKSETGNRKLEIGNWKLWHLFKLQISNFKLPISNFKFQIPNFQFPNFKFLIPAAAMVAIFFILFSLTGPSVSVSGPSAIVKSFSGDTSSVIILETPESRQTIIWFNESLLSEDKKNDVQETNRTSIMGCSDRRAGRAGPVRT